MNQATEHVKENKVIYTLLTIVLGAGGIGKVTDNLPVTQGEFVDHVAQYSEAEDKLEVIQGSLESLILAQLRASLHEAYEDRCGEDDPEAIEYIDKLIRGLRQQYRDITGESFEKPPCGSTP
jgi:hypothetical protein